MSKYFILGFNKALQWPRRALIFLGLHTLKATPWQHCYPANIMRYYFSSLLEFSSIVDNAMSLIQTTLVLPAASPNDASSEGICAPHTHPRRSLTGRPRIKLLSPDLRRESGIHVHPRRAHAGLPPLYDSTNSRFHMRCMSTGSGDHGIA